MPHKDELNVIGTRQPRLDGPEKCSGRSIFGDDVALPGLLCGKILRSRYAHARILSIDTSKAEALPGVKVVITAADAEGIMGSRRGSEPVFCKDIDTATRLYHDLDASAVMINDHSAFRDDVMPFAGLRESGLGVGGIPYTMEDMQIDKMMVIKQT